MTYRYTEEELADIQKRMNANLANFQRNSGRGLPPATVQAMEAARGVQLDDNGVPLAVPLAAPPPAKKAPKRIKKAGQSVPTEFQECCWLMDWAETQRFHGIAVSRLLILVPNGAYHGKDRKAGAVIARKLREQGLQEGTSDYILPVPIWTKQCPGLWLEMKRTKRSVVSADQREFHDLMLQLGWHCEVAKGWVEASTYVTDHLRSATLR